MEPVSQFVTSSGRIIYSFPVRTFPSLVANIYLVADGERLILVDTGSGMEDSNKDLLAGFQAISDTYGRPVSLDDVDVICITHGHIDHFGGLPFVRQFTKAPIAVHPLDRRILSAYEERVIVASRRLETFLIGAGVIAKRREKLMAMYLFAKGVYRSTAVEFSLDDGEFALDLFSVHHVPGHCPGQVCLQVDDLLLTADHVLSYTTPHQVPESITNNMGLGHYLDSLAKVALLEDVSLALGGHEEPMSDLPGRVNEIEMVHRERLSQVLDICHQPKTTVEISQELFGQVSSYHVLLALEEAGAHIEYLYQRGELVVDNLGEIEKDPEPVFQYRRL